MSFIVISSIVFVVVSLLYLVSFWLSQKRGNIEKLTAYESGFEPLGDARMKFDIIYWIIGL